MTMPTTVKLSRRGWGSSHSRHARPWKVEVDGKTVGTISNEETVELRLEPGRHAFRFLGEVVPQFGVGFTGDRLVPIRIRSRASALSEMKPGIRHPPAC